MDADALARAKDLAAGHLGRRTRSVREMETYLERKGVAAAVRSQVIRDFLRVGLLDDRALARDWVERRTAGSPWGRRALASRLAARGVAADVIAGVLDEMLAGDAEDRLCRRAATERCARLGRVPPAKRRDRLYRYLLGRGFPPETVRDVVEDMSRDMQEPE